MGRKRGGKKKCQIYFFILSPIPKEKRGKEMEKKEKKEKGKKRKRRIIIYGQWSNKIVQC